MNEFLVKLIANGGPGSGNFNPGQGRGVGKPGSGSKSSSSTKSKTGEKSKEKIDKFSSKWKEKGLDKPASSVPELEKQIKDAKELYKEFEKEYNPADAAELGASLRVEKTIKEMEDTLDRLKQDKADAEKIRKEVTEKFLVEEPTERTKERVRKKIIEMEPGYDYDEYDKLSDHAFDLVDGCDSYGDLRNMLRREYSGFLSDSEIDDLIGLTDELEAYNPF